MTYRFDPPHPCEETDREHPADREDRLCQSARDAEAVAETRAESYDGNPFLWIDDATMAPDGSMQVVFAFPPGMPDKFVDSVCVSGLVLLNRLYCAAGGRGFTLKAPEHIEDPEPFDEFTGGWGAPLRRGEV